jgi:hypothetical protein
MKKIYKIALLISTAAVIFAGANLAVAAGKGYFLEKNNSFYIFDNLFINGFLTVEENLTGITAKPGDVLVEKKFMLDENKNIYFCQDERVPKVNIPLNLDCAKKLLVWNPDSLTVLSSKNQLITNRLSAPTGFIFLNVPSGKTIYTKDPVKAFCFANTFVCWGGSSNGARCDITNAASCPGGACSACNPGQLKTETFYAKTIAPLAANSDKIMLRGQRLVFDEINLGDELNVKNNHYVCWKADSQAGNCGTATDGIKNSKWDFNFTASNGTVYSFPDGGFYSVSTNMKLCCYLQLTF